MDNKSQQEPLTDREKMILKKILEMAGKSNGGTESEKISKISQFLGSV